MSRHWGKRKRRKKKTDGSERKTDTGTEKSVMEQKACGKR